MAWPGPDATLSPIMNARVAGVQILDMRARAETRIELTAEQAMDDFGTAVVAYEIKPGTRVLIYDKHHHALWTGIEANQLPTASLRVFSKFGEGVVGCVFRCDQSQWCQRNGCQIIKAIRFERQGITTLGQVQKRRNGDAHAHRQAIRFGAHRR